MTVTDGNVKVRSPTCCEVSKIGDVVSCGSGSGSLVVLDSLNGMEGGFGLEENEAHLIKLPTMQVGLDSSKLDAGKKALNIYVDKEVRPEDSRTGEGVRLENTHLRFEESDFSDFSDYVDDVLDDLTLLKYSKKQRHKRRQRKTNFNPLGVPKFLALADQLKSGKGGMRVVSKRASKDILVTSVDEGVNINSVQNCVSSERQTSRV